MQTAELGKKRGVSKEGEVCSLQSRVPRDEPWAAEKKRFLRQREERVEFAPLHEAEESCWAVKQEGEG